MNFPFFSHLMFSPLEIIIHKRDGFSLDYPEIKYMVDSYVNGELPDYQMSAFLMTIFYKGLDIEELYGLTKCYVESGSQINFPADWITVDKHSTGGVGDKISFIIGPLFAHLGYKNPMIAGRGLGFTGGTIDKLESIPGFQTNLSVEDFKKNLSKSGICIMGQSEILVPADKKIYALRDVAGSVESLPLITASILSKKIAEGTKNLVIDMKVGSGAFVKEFSTAKKLAMLLKTTSERFNLNLEVVFSNMNQPLGCATGNALEIKETIDILTGKRSYQDIEAVVFELTKKILSMTGQKMNDQEIDKFIKAAIEKGFLLDIFTEMVYNQKGKLVLNSPDYGLKIADKVKEVKSDSSGWIKEIDTRTMGFALIDLKAGRKNFKSKLDHSTGVKFFKKVGDRVSKGDRLAKIYYSDESSIKDVSKKVLNSYHFSEKEVRPPKIIL